MELEEQKLTLKNASDDEIAAEAVSLMEGGPDLGERYDVLALIASGGMSTVYKIYDKTLGKIFAAKVMTDDLASEPIALRRFADEAEAASSMTHGNIAAVYNHGLTKENVPFLCMDYLEGETLEQLIQREGKLEARRAVGIFQQICEALIHAHMKGIIHRDLKPSNIFITKNADDVEVVKLVDFGIAKLDYRESDSTRLTQTGTLIGSPQYMSPEQCRGEKQDARSDIYSMGCLMYNAITGKPPFVEDNPVKIVLKHLKDKPASLGIDKDEDSFGAALEACVFRCLEKDPSARYQSADELLLQFHSLDYKKQDEMTRVEAKPAPWRRLFATIIDAYVLTILINVLGYTFLGAFNESFWDMNYLAQVAPWQLDLLRNYCQFMGPMVAPLVFIYFVSVFLFPAVLCFTFMSVMSMPFFGSYGSFILFHLAPFIFGLYCVLMDCSSLQGTIGKRLLNIVVVDEKGGRITFVQALRRFLSEWIAPVIFFAAYAATPILAKHQSPAGNFLATTWELMKFYPPDGFAGSYVVKKERHAISISKDRYRVFKPALSLAKFQVMRKRWHQQAIIHMVIAALTLCLIYFIAPQSMVWMAPCFLLLFALPYLVIDRRIAQLQAKGKSKLSSEFDASTAIE